MAIPDLEPMLAGAGVPATVDGWVAEPKLDGWRARVLVDPKLPDGVAVRTRRGRTITAPVPGVVELAKSGLRLVLDGELVAHAGRAHDFYSLGPSLAGARRNSTPLTFCAFDLLWLDGDLLTDQPYEKRRAVLEELELPRPTGVVPRFEGDVAADLLRACEAHGVEGVVLKRMASLYWPGKRTKDWRKVKVSAWRTEHLERRRPR